MALEDPNNIEKTSPVAAQEPATETEHGAVKKKIEIPGFGEIEYTEKRVMFPEKIVQETGGVKGYVRKMVSWDELEKFPDLGTRRLLEELTNNNFPNNTYNHVMGTGEISREVFAQERLLLQKIGNSKSIVSIMNKQNEERFLDKSIGLHAPQGYNEGYCRGESLLPNINGFFAYSRDGLLGSAHRSTKLTNFIKEVSPTEIISQKLLNSRVKEKTISDHIENRFDPFFSYDFLTVLDAKERMEFIEAVLKSDKYLYVGFPGLSLDLKGRVWDNSIRKETPLFGFGANNTAFKNYLVNLIKLHFPRKYWPKKINSDDEKNLLKGFLWDPSKPEDVEDYYHGRAPIKGNQDDNYFDPVSFSKLIQSWPKILDDLENTHQPNRRNLTEKDFPGIRTKHPLIPYIINHPDIPELRWCHADYAAIPAKNGYNILEMIT